MGGMDLCTYYRKLIHRKARQKIAPQNVPKHMYKHILFETPDGAIRSRGHGLEALGQESQQPQIDDMLHGLYQVVGIWLRTYQATVLASIIEYRIKMRRIAQVKVPTAVSYGNSLPAWNLGKRVFPTGTG